VTFGLIENGETKWYDAESLASLKAQIWMDIGIPPHYQCLLLNGNTLEEEKQIEDIKEGGRARLACDTRGLDGGCCCEKDEKEIKCRVFCVYIGLDKHWTECRACCIKSGCSIQ